MAKPRSRSRAPPSPSRRTVPRRRGGRQGRRDRILSARRHRLHPRAQPAPPDTALLVVARRVRHREPLVARARPSGDSRGAPRQAQCDFRRDDGFIGKELGLASGRPLLRSRWLGRRRAQEPGGAVVIVIPSRPAALRFSQRIHRSQAPCLSRRGLRSGSGSRPRCEHLQPLLYTQSCWSSGGLRRVPWR